jgi:hypothetical protein
MKGMAILSAMHRYTLMIAYNKIPRQISPNTPIHSSYPKVYKQCFGNEKAGRTQF